jgi:hypothetical protein
MKSPSTCAPLLLVFLLTATFAISQIDTEILPPDKDLGDLYRRAAASRFVVLATVLESSGVAKRLSVSDKEKMTTPGPGGKGVIVSLPALGGSLYKVRVEETLCRQGDFDITTAASLRSSTEPSQTEYIFLPRNEPIFTEGHRQEILFPSHRYLLLLAEPSKERQREWTRVFELDPGRDYYRGEQLSRGVVPLTQPTAQNPSPKQPPVVEKLRLLCQAVRPTKLEDKLSGLKKLEASGDPVLQKEAKIAASALRSRAVPRKN